MASSQPTIFNCAICHRPVSLETAKTDDKGKVIHTECYVVGVVAKHPAGSTNPQPSS
jgi:hypothetical protein